MMVLMSHPDYGFVHVYTDRELQERKQKGWTEVTEEKEEKPKRKYTRKAEA